MSEEDLRDQINKIAVEIEKIEASAKKKEEYVRTKVTEEFDHKINELELKLKSQQEVLDDLNNKINELASKKKELISIIKTFEKQYNDLKREKEKALNDKLKAIVKEKKTKTKVVDREIKNLEKELKSDKK
ncbi:MAG: hypothetical protein ACFFCI_11550 [Promethearchaeota archaeon]